MGDRRWKLVNGRRGWINEGFITTFYRLPFTRCLLQAIMKKTETAAAHTSLSGLLNSVRSLIYSARQAAYKSVNAIQVLTNYEIGRRIVRHEQGGKERAEYGKHVLAALSERLAAEFGRGFSADNLANMRKFYLTYQNRRPGISEKPSRKSGTPPAQAFKLSWSHYVFLCGICDKGERGFYEIEAMENNWSLPEMRRQFNSGFYERLALSRNKKGVQRLAKAGQVITKAGDIFKEPYVLEFLGLEEKAKYSESDLESAIIDKIERFLL